MCSPSPIIPVPIIIHSHDHMLTMCPCYKSCVKMSERCQVVKKMSKNTQNVHRKYFWPIYQNWHQYLWTSLCQFINFFVNPPPPTPLVQIFDFLTLDIFLTNCIFFWLFDIFLLTLKPPQPFTELVLFVILFAMVLLCFKLTFFCVWVCRVQDIILSSGRRGRTYLYALL